MNGKLWAENGPWGTVPPVRRQVDGHVAAFQNVLGDFAYVLGRNSRLWFETGPWGSVPPMRHPVLVGARRRM
jgi:hypothetical protein